MADVPPRPAFIHSERTAATPCPVCLTAHDAFTAVSLNADAPRPRLKIGDVTVCASCGTILKVTTLGFWPATDDDLRALDPDLRKLVFGFSAMRQGGPLPRDRQS